MVKSSRASLAEYLQIVSKSVAVTRLQLCGLFAASFSVRIDVPWPEGKKFRLFCSGSLGITECGERGGRAIVSSDGGVGLGRVGLGTNLALWCDCYGGEMLRWWGRQMGTAGPFVRLAMACREVGILFTKLIKCSCPVFTVHLIDVEFLTQT